MLGLASDDAALRDLFDGSEHGPAPIEATERVPVPGIVPDWITARLSPLVDEGEHAALIDRAPLDLRVNLARADRDKVRMDVGGERTPLSPWGLRLETGTPVEGSEAFKSGAVEIQDEASQLVALVCAPRAGETLLDLCAGAGGKALALAAAEPDARIVASDVDKRRLGQLGPRALRAGAEIETLLLDPPREAEALMPYREQFDCVLVDAPCSGSGTWRRSPELRWRLTPERLDDLVATQERVLELAAPLVRPGGRLVYAVCSLIDAEGTAQLERFLSAHSSFVAKDIFEFGGGSAGGRLLTPGHDGTDGFFVARLEKS